MEIPNARAHFGVTKKGYLQKLSSRGFPYIPTPWKRKYCVLVKGILYYYEKEDSKGVDKGNGIINLEYYDQVIPAPPKDSKKATHAFLLHAQDKSFFDPGRHLFSADSSQNMNEWIRHLKKAIEQIRINNRTNPSAAAATAAHGCVDSASSLNIATQGSSNPSSPRGPKGGVKQLVKRKEGTAEGGKENKENLPEDFSKPSADSAARRRRANPSSRSMDDGSLDPNLNIARKKAADSQDPNSAHSSLGRKQKTKSAAFSKGKLGGGDFESNVNSSGGPNPFSSLGRQMPSNTAKSGAGESGADTSGCSGTSGASGMERRKRKAEDEDVDGDLMGVVEAGPHLESVTKHRVKGPAGRRMPQNRRTHQMKHRASSLSALGHNAAEYAGSQDNASNSFVPWLNRSLDLLGEDIEGQEGHQAGLSFVYSDQEDLEDPEELLYEYNISYHDDRNTNLTFDENTSVAAAGTGLYVSDIISQPGVVPPPLPPRMESRMDFPQQQANQYQIHQLQQQQQLQHQLQQMQFQATLQQQNQMCSPFGTLQNPGGAGGDLLSEREMKNQHRRSQPADELAMMTRSLTNELFISSYSDETSCDASNPQLNQGQQSSRPNSQAMGGLKQTRTRANNGRVGGSKNGRKQNAVYQPDINRFTVAVRNLQKHVVELDQAVNGITKEVEDSKLDLGNVKSSVAAIKKDKEKLSDAVSIVTQEVTKMKEQVNAAVKEAEKLQKTATAALVVAEKAKLDQNNLKKEYESMIKDLKTTIQDIKKEAQGSLSVTPSPCIRKKRSGIDHSDAEGAATSDDEGVEEEETDKQDRKKNKSRQKSSTPNGSSSKLNDIKYEGSSGKSGGYHNFFSRPSSIISGFTSIGRSSGNIEGDKSLKKNKKDKANKNVKNLRQLGDDFPMMDETLNPRHLHPSEAEKDDTELLKENSNFDLGKSTSSPTVANRPKVLNLKSQKSDASTVHKTNSAASSPDSPTRSSSPFDVPKFQVNGRATSPTGFTTNLHRPGSTPGPMNRQGSMSTVPEDRAIDVRTFENRPSEPPPPPPTNRVFAISRQTSTPNIATQKLSTPLGLQRQHSLGVVLEENKTLSRQSSILSMPDDRLLVDQTLPMSPTQSLMSFPGSWSTTSLNKPEGSVVNIAEGTSYRAKGSPVPPRAKNPLEMVAGGVLSGSSLKTGIVCPFDEKNEDGPLATSSLKKRKKIKKEPIVV